MKDLILVLPIIIGFCLDLIIGDPYNLLHPVRFIGRLISLLEKVFRKLMPNHLLIGGTLLSLTVLTSSTAVPLFILWLSYNINLYVGIAIESILIYYILSAKCLSKESMKVFKYIEKNDIQNARHKVSMIVGRDTEMLDKSGVIRATVESVAENTSDGETAPLFYIALGGAVLGFFYKATNTMDSMLGYKNDKYIYFGNFSAKLDDILNYIPSRLSAIMIIISAYILGFNGRGAAKIWIRDRNSQTSPNATQTESAVAGALNVRLLGNAYYFGVLHNKNTVGDDIRPIEPSDINRTNKLMFCTSAIMLVFSVIVRWIIVAIII